MTRLTRASLELAVVIAFVWAVCAMASALEPFAMRGTA